MTSNWTEDQKKAISSTGGTVLVAAAAGSGKTSVLVQRVIDRITDEKNPVDLDKFLIVTFTNSAAREMKDRISSSLSNLLTKNPGNLNLHRQQMLLKSAQIGTIHSFCNNIVKENFFRLGISPNFKIGTSSELGIIKERALENTFEHFYSSEKEKFTRILDIFSGEKNTEKLESTVFALNEFMNSLAFPEIWLEKKLRLYDEASSSEDKNIWMKTIVDYSLGAVDYAICLLEDALKTSGDFEDLKKSYFETLSADIDMLKNLKISLETESWSEISKKVNGILFARLKPCRTKENEELKNEIVMKRNSAKEVISGLKGHFVSNGDEIKEIGQILKDLFEITLYFRNEVWALKLVRNMIDFSDLERLAIEVLAENAEPLEKSSVAKEISERFTEVMVDEYQDINEVQDTIFKLITKNESNLFMVGDVKQSIYKFRQSRPKIFLSKKGSFAVYDENKDLYPAKIILGKNFRSKAAVISSVNFIFRCLMSEKVGEIDYNDEEKLFPGAEYEETGEKDVSVKFIKASSDEDTSVLEAREIAKTIMQMISSGYKVKKGDSYRNATYSDFCILLRKSNAFAHIYAKELSACAIPAWTETNDKFLETTEISVILSILKVIDNATDDVPLISCMLSPLFGFNIDELSKIRSLNRDIPFYFALKDYAKNSEKLEKFLEKIDYFRKISGTMPCSELIDFIYETTQYPSICLALPGGEIKKANLILLRDYAKKFDEDLSKGLSGFLNFIKNLQKKNADLPSAFVSSEADNTVKIMSIHKSKGLEFPVCIIAGCSKKFNKDSGDLVIHPELGFGIKTRSADGLSQHSNLVFDAINLKNESENTSEEVRILYVALTRAKQKLIIMASVKDERKITEKCLLIQSFSSVNPYLVGSSSSFLDWILICICFSSAKRQLFEAFGIGNQLLENSENSGNLNWDIEFLKPDSSLSELPEEEILNEPCQQAENIDEDFLKKLEEISNFKYPFEKSSQAPIKIAASKLSHSGEWQNYFAASVPAFMSASNTSATARGTAMHKFMCLAEIKAAREDLSREIERLLNRGLFSSQEAKLLNKISIEKFLNSNLCERILKSKKVLREFKFSVKMPLSASLFEEDEKDENSVVVQGAMDCAFLEDDGFVIVDYKTDKTENMQSLYEKYVSQLSIYKYALEETQNLKVKETGIYSFYLSDYLC